MTQALGHYGTLAVVPPALYEAQLQRQTDQRAQAAQAARPVDPLKDATQLAGYIRSQYEIMRNHRNSMSGWNDRLLNAMRTFSGQYDAAQLADISKFGGSDIYIRMTAQKCRSASALLRDVYLGADRPWGLRPPADPDVPPEILAHITQLVQMEAAQSGMDETDLEDRKRLMIEAAQEIARKRATDQAQLAEDKIEELLRNGNFYTALSELLIDLPQFPFAVLKGPVVKVFPEITWVNGTAQVQPKPRLHWYRVSPFDFYFTPGVANIENANCIERQQITRAEINDMLDLPGYNTGNVQAVLRDYGAGGLYDNWDTTDSERAVLESRENPAWNRSGLLAMMEFNGNVQGQMLIQYGLKVDDELRDYHVQVWMIGQYVVKVQLSPSPRVRHPYFVTSFEKIPGTVVGNGLTDIIADLQAAANGTARAMMNNMAMCSGPQVVVNDDRLAPDENGNDMFPWKRWHVRSDPIATNSAANKPIEFFQPQSNAAELLSVLEKIFSIADDVSAIPKYVSGGAAGGGAGRTASGLAMLMGNASKILQTVSGNVDRDVLEQGLQQLFDLILLTDTSGVLTGEEEISVLGVNVAIQKETNRQRQIEFLGQTNNPTDGKLMGLKGRASVLRSISRTIGLDGEEVVPTDDKVAQMQEQQEQHDQQNTPIKQMVDKATTEGVGAAVKRITTELVSGMLAPQEQLPYGNPTHIGTPQAPGAPGQPASPAGAPPVPGGVGGASGGPPAAPMQGGVQTNTVTPAAPSGPMAGPH